MSGATASSIGAPASSCGELILSAVRQSVAAVTARVVAVRALVAAVPSPCEAAQTGEACAEKQECTGFRHNKDSADLPAWETQGRRRVDIQVGFLVLDSRL